MKKLFHMLAACVAWLLACAVGGCKVDTLEDIKSLTPKVSLVQTGSGQVSLKPDDMVVDKDRSLLRKTLGIAYAGYDRNQAFTADVTLDFSNVPDGYEPFAPGECFITTGPDEKTPGAVVAVPAGVSNQPFYINITKAAIDAHPGKKLAATVRMVKTSLYTANEKADSVMLLMDMNDFGNVKVDVTAAYIRNPNFARAPGTTDRFAALADWLSNAAVADSRPQGAGFDANVVKFGIERWSGGDKSIINGKIYQTIQLPKGNYQVEVAMGTVIPDRDTYVAVAAGASLPDDVQISSAIASRLITTEFNNNTLKLPFSIGADQQVTLGFLLNFDQGMQKVLQASSFKMYRIESLFD
jgi:hypothetical protein